MVWIITYIIKYYIKNDLFVIKYYVNVDMQIAVKFEKKVHFKTMSNKL